MAQNNNNMYPWLTDEQIKRLEEVISWLTWAEKESARTQIYNAVLKKNQEEKWDNDRTEAKNELRYMWMTNKDQPTWTSQVSSANLETLVDIAKKSWWSDPKQDSWEVFSGIVSMARDKNIKEETLNNYLNHLDPEFLYQMWFEERPEQNYALQNNLWTLKDWWIGAGIWLWVAWTKTFWNVARGAYWITIPTSQKDKYLKYVRNTTSNEIDRYNKEIAKREKIIAEAEKNPKYTESMKQSIREKYWAEIDSFKQTVNDAENRLNKAIDTPTTAESAYKYWVKWSTVDAIWEKAMEEANVLWNAWIKLKLDTSKQTLNLKELLDGININELAKDKTDLKWLEEALETMKTLYKDAKYWNMSMAAANDFKSNLYDKIPPKAFEWKNVSAFNKVITAISQSVKNKTQQMLTQEFWEDVAKQYKEWANLHSVQESSMLEWVGKSNLVERSLMNKLTSLVQAVTNPLFSEWWYYASKLNEWIRSWLSKAKDAVVWAVESIKNNPIETAKKWAKWAKWLLRENALFAVWEKFTEDAKDEIDKWYLGKSTLLFWNKASKEEATEWLKDPEFVQYLKDTWMNPSKIIKDMWLDEKEINTALNNQKKLETQSKVKKIQGSTVEWKLKTELENANKVNPQLKKQTTLKNQNSKIWTDEKYEQKKKNQDALERELASAKQELKDAETDMKKYYKKVWTRWYQYLTQASQENITIWQNKEEKVKRYKDAEKKVKELEKKLKKSSK